MHNNAIVIMFDSLQFNYVGCYGNDWIKTPNMDRLAREGVLFENCYTEGLPTVPCRRAMHTGRYTLPFNGWSPLTMEDTTIADLCWGRPIDTALIFDAPPYRQPKFGYTRGFDKVWFTHGHELDSAYYDGDPLYHFDMQEFMDDDVLKNARKQLGETAVEAQFHEISSYLKQMQYWNSAEDRYVARTIRKAVEYLEQVDRNKQFYLWIDSFDPHEPWNPPSVYLGYPCPYDPDYKGKHDFLPFMGDVAGVYNEAQLHHVRMLYAELVTLCDTYLGVLLDAMRRLGLEEDTLLMMVSDHGEPMGNAEHGHGIMRKIRPWPYEELAHTPMLLRAPGIKPGQRISAFVQSCDVAPTICDWLGIGVHPQMHGKSLLPLARGEASKVRDFAVAGYFKAGWAIYTEDWSYVHWPLNDKATMAFHLDGSKELNSVLNSFGKGQKASLFDKEAMNKASDELRRQQKEATLDGQEKWTCTPGAAYITPEADELYNRKTDPFQLKNVAGEHPDVCQKLLLQLKDFMDDLKSK